MKYRRKPVSRDIVDAIRNKDTYIVQRDEGVENIGSAEFERDYEPMKRKPREKKIKRKKGKDDMMGAAAAQQSRQ